MRTHTHRSPRLKPLAACLAVSMAAAYAGGLLSAGPAFAAGHAPKTLSTAKLSRSDHERLAASAREHRRALRGSESAHLRPATHPAGTALTVTSCDDDGSPGTLRYEIGAAASGDTVDLTQLSCSTITLTSGQIEIAVDDLTIAGPGASALTIDAGGSGRALYHFSDSEAGTGTLTIQGVTIANGSYFDDYMLASGGCIFAGGNVTLSGATVTDCEVSGKYAGGGGVYAVGDVTLADSTISGNKAIGNAFKYDENTQQDEPQPGGQGAGLYAGGAVAITRSTISGNEARLENGAPTFNRGGGVFAFGPISITDSAVVGNLATGSFDLGYGGLGGGVFSNSEEGSLQITNSTISGNRAETGAGVLSFSALDVANSTVAFNTAEETGAGGGGILDLHDEAYGSSVVNGTIVANNAGAGASFDADFGSYGITLGGAANLIIAASGTTLPPDTLSGDPLLQPLADNGGPTKTHALGAGSPAIDAGNNVKALPFDQRGTPFERESGEGADIGAFEVQSSDVIFKDGFDG